MRKSIPYLDIIVGLAIFAVPISMYLYIWYLSIKLFLVPAMKLFFSLYGIWGTLGIWTALTLGAFCCGYFFMKLCAISKPSSFQPTFKE